MKLSAMVTRAVASVSIIVIILAPITAGFDRQQCYEQTLSMLSNMTLAINDTLFYRDNNRQPMSNPDNLTITLYGCRKLCKASQNWFPGIASWPVIWLIPIVLLL